jgi:hypothetical protein
VTVTIDELGIGSFVEQISHQIYPPGLSRGVKSRHAFVRRGCAGDAHGIGFRASDLSIHIGAVR